MEPKIRAYRDQDAAALWKLFHDTVRIVNRRDYTAEQVRAWAPDECDAQAWRARIGALAPFVAEAGSRLIGYADVQDIGYIGHFFVHHRWQRKGIGSLLMRAIHDTAQERGTDRLFCHVSVTARPFFEAWGFAVTEEETVELRGVRLPRLGMEKSLAGSIRSARRKTP